MHTCLLCAAFKSATALSQSTITAGSLISVAIGLTQRRPGAPDLPLIDFQLALMLLPLLLVGVSYGEPLRWHTEGGWMVGCGLGGGDVQSRLIRHAMVCLHDR